MVNHAWVARDWFSGRRGERTVCLPSAASRLGRHRRSGVGVPCLPRSCLAERGQQRPPQRLAAHGRTLRASGWSQPRTLAVCLVRSNRLAWNKYTLSPIMSHVLEMVRKTLGTAEIDRVVDACYKTYPNGFVANVQKGDVPSRYQSLATYLAKYVVSPPISLRRIDRYDGQRVTYHYRSHKSERVEQETVDVFTFIGRMIQHTFAKGFKRIRSYGVQATKTFAKIKAMIQAALAKVKGIVHGAIKIIAAKNYRERYRQSTGRDPLICPHCQHEMGLWKIWHPKYGVVYDELDAMKRG